jgi:hemolysin activation/secretion protein
MAPDQAANVKFLLHRIEISGASALNEGVLSESWSRYVEKEISVATLYEIVTAITAQYAQAGYALSFALLPEQDVTDGVVKISVVEGYVDDVAVNGAGDGTGRLSLNAQVKYQIQKIKASRPLKTDDLERALLLLNDIPGVKARAVFSASKSSPGASVLTLNIERDRVQGSADINNRMAEDLGSWRAGGSATLNGAVTGTDALTLSVYSALDMDGFVFGGGRFEQRLTGDGLLLTVTGSYSKDLPLQGLLKAVEFEGRDVSGSVGLSYPLIRSRPENLTAELNFLVNNTDTKTLGVPLTDDKLRVIEAALTYDFYGTDGSVNLIKGTLTQGLDIFGATDDDSLLKSRANGSASFLNFGVYGSRLQPLTERFSLFGQLQAQAALDDPLLAVRECAYGGATVGRAYDAGSLSGDHCVEGLAEIRYDHMMMGLGVQLYSYADAAYVLQKGTLEVGEKRSETASSAGGGVRLFLGDAINLNVEVGVPLNKEFTKGGQGDTRAFVSAAARF